jgi:N utilization substance protein B
MDSDIYKEYMASETSSYEEDRELWRKIYKRIIFNNDELDQVLEDQSLYWNDDKEIVDTFVLKTIKRFDEKSGAKQELLPEFKDEEDQDFARRLFRRTILNAEYYRHLISENTRNWDLDRVALMDIIIMQIALAEILSFPNIPVSVTLNEYVEIAKLYSTPKSGSFINGTLDGIVNALKKENKLTKN